MLATGSGPGRGASSREGPDIGAGVSVVSGRALGPVSVGMPAVRCGPLRDAGRSPYCSGIGHGLASRAVGAGGGGKAEPPLRGLGIRPMQGILTRPAQG